MNEINDRFGYDSLAFFGRVNASISHELKNVMAIISETSGLLSDLSDMASTGTPVSPDMLKDCTQSIVEEIQRGFLVIRQMNRFAHSIDIPMAPVDIKEIVDLSINLSNYLSFAGNIELLAHGESPALAVTCPFLLQAIVYQTLFYTFKIAGNGANVTITIVQDDQTKGWRIVFSGFSVGGFDAYPDPLIKRMAASIKVGIRCDPTDDRMELFVPETIDDRPTTAT